MKIRIISLLILSSLFITFANAHITFAIPKEIEYALKLNRINHFDEALNVIRKALAQEKIKPDITSAYTVGRILYRKGEIYREMAKINVQTNVGYLLQIEKVKASERDVFKLFLGMGYFYTMQYLESAGILNQVVRNKSLKDNLYEIAILYLGASYYKSNEHNKAFELWKQLNPNNLLSQSFLGYLYAYLGINPSQGEMLTREALEKSGGGSGKYTTMFRVHHAYTLLALGQFDEAYKEVETIDLNVPLYVYSPNQKKQVRFYDLSLLDSYSKIIFGESIKNLEPIVTASSGELAGFAAFYVSQMYLYLGNYSTALKYSQKAQRLAVTGSLTMIRAIACEASLNILSGKKKKGLRSLNDEVQLIYGKPSYLLEMMKVVIMSGVKYDDVRELVATVESYLYTMKWERKRRDTALLGELSMYAGRNVKAIYYLERARDKGNKNKIETNDPEFLIKLAYVYYVKEYYPESLEILFSLSRYFTGVRTIQDAVQSMYSYRQKGTGETLID